jgi:hypothetical protein
MPILFLIVALFGLSPHFAQAEMGNPQFVELLRQRGLIKEDVLPFCDATREDFRLLQGMSAGSFLFHKIGDSYLFISFLDRRGNYRVSSLPLDFETPLLAGGPPRWLEVVGEFESWRGPISQAQWTALGRASSGELLYPLVMSPESGQHGDRELPAGWEVLWEQQRPLFCESDQIIEDSEGFLPIRGPVVDVAQAETWVSRALDQHPQFKRSQLHGSQLLHGGSSASLLAFTEYGGGTGHLIPTGELERQNRVPFCGEIVFGRKGVNLTHLSTVWVGALKQALRYAVTAIWNPEFGQERLIESQQSRSSVERNAREITAKRLEQWGKLTALEQSLVSDSFPVLFGLKVSRPWVQVGVGSDVPGEIGLVGGALAEEIRVIFVPQERMELVQKILARFPTIAIEPLESFRFDE